MDELCSAYLWEPDHRLADAGADVKRWMSEARDAYTANLNLRATLTPEIDDSTFDLDSATEPISAPAEGDTAALPSKSFDRPSTRRPPVARLRLLRPHSPSVAYQSRLAHCHTLFLDDSAAPSDCLCYVRDSA